MEESRKSKIQETQQQRAIKGYESKIMKANQRLGNLKKSFGEKSPLYQAYKLELEQEFATMGMSHLISEGPTGAIKIDKKRAAYEIAHMRRNERNLFSGTIGAVPKVTDLKKEAAKKLGKSARKVTVEEVEANIQVEQDMKAAIQTFYTLLKGDDYRKILLPELYTNNHGNLNEDKVKSVIEFYSAKGTDFVSTATKEQLEALRSEAMTSYGKSKQI